MPAPCLYREAARLARQRRLVEAAQDSRREPRYAGKSGAVACLSVPHRTGCSVAGMPGREPSVRAVYGNGQGLLGNLAVMPRRLPVAAGALWPWPGHLTDAPW